MVVPPFYDDEGKLVTEPHLINRIIIARELAKEDRSFQEKHNRPRRADEPPRQSWLYGQTFPSRNSNQQPPKNWAHGDPKDPEASFTIPVVDKAAMEPHLPKFEAILLKISPDTFPCSLRQFIEAMNEVADVEIPDEPTFKPFAVKHLIDAFETHVTYDEKLDIVSYRMRPFSLGGQVEGWSWFFHFLTWRLIL